MTAQEACLSGAYLSGYGSLMRAEDLAKPTSMFQVQNAGQVGWQQGGSFNLSGQQNVLPWAACKEWHACALRRLFGLRLTACSAYGMHAVSFQGNRPCHSTAEECASGTKPFENHPQYPHQLLEARPLCPNVHGGATVFCRQR